MAVMPLQAVTAVSIPRLEKRGGVGVPEDRIHVGPLVLLISKLQDPVDVITYLFHLIRKVSPTLPIQAHLCKYWSL
jgi:hypothetical protein